MRPIKTAPVFQDYLWGGEKLRTQYGKQSDLAILAESWELSCNEAGLTGIAGEEGSLKAFLSTQDEKFLGTQYDKTKDFPIMIKFIDAKQDLSVQVHPDDAYALTHENSYGKTEMWVVMSCEPEAILYYGLNQDCTQEQLSKAAQDGTLTQYLNAVKVKAGDVFFIPAGTIHAIGGGMVIAEIQQNSNITYRLFDFGRKDANGNLRPLHLEKGVTVSRLTKQEVKTPEIGSSPVNLLASCPYFSTFLVDCSDKITFSTKKETFEVLLFLEGEGVLTGDFAEIPVKAGDCLMVPATLGDYQLTGTCKCLRVFPMEVSADQ